MILLGIPTKFPNSIIYYMHVDSELLFDNRNMLYETSILLGYIADQNRISALEKVSGGSVISQLFEVSLPWVFTSFRISLKYV